MRPRIRYSAGNGYPQPDACGPSTARMGRAVGNPARFREVARTQPVAVKRSEVCLTSCLKGHRSPCVVTRRTVLHSVKGSDIQREIAYGSRWLSSATPGDDLVRPQARSFEPADPPPPITDTAARRYCIEEMSISQ